MPELERVGADRLGALGEVTRGIFDGERPGIVVQGLVDPALCARAVAELAGGAARARRMGSYPGRTYGIVLLTTEDLDAYRAAARELERALPAELLGAITRAHRGLAPGHEVAVPRDRDGAYYAALTVRRLDAGEGIAVHSERADWPSMAALRATLDLSTQVSFYLLLQAPEAGGELVLYEGRDAARDPGAEDGRPVPLAVGDLVVFDGGRYNHEVRPVRGGRARWTLGGFAAFAGRRLYFWS